MKKNAIITLVFGLILTACGADGPPERPSAAPVVEITGKVEIGVVGGS